MGVRNAEYDVFQLPRALVFYLWFVPTALPWQGGGGEVFSVLQPRGESAHPQAGFPAVGRTWCSSGCRDGTPKCPFLTSPNSWDNPAMLPPELPTTLPKQSGISGARSTGALGWRLQLITNHCPTFWYGWPDLYNGASSHRGVYRAQAGCAPGCLTALSAPVIFLGSCFHDKIFSDSIFAHKPLKVCFCLVEELPLFGIQPVFKQQSCVLHVISIMFLETKFGLLSVKPRVCLRKVEFVAGWLLISPWCQTSCGECCESSGVGCVCSAGNCNKQKSLWSSCSLGRSSCLSLKETQIHTGGRPSQRSSG